MQKPARQQGLKLNAEARASARAEIKCRSPRVSKGYDLIPLKPNLLQKGKPLLTRGLLPGRS